MEDRPNTRRDATWKIDRIHGIDVNLEDRQNTQTSDSGGVCLLPLGLKELTSSLSLGVPVPRPTQCMRGT
jgi:hypothetical protein